MLKLCIALLYFSSYSLASQFGAWPWCRFTCSNLDDGQVIINNQKYKCPNNQVCNKFNVLLDDNTCRSCLSLEEMCGRIYTCDPINDQVVNIEDTRLQCPQFYRCSDPNPNCEPCQRRTCPRRYWNCTLDDPIKFTINDIDLQCAAGFVCNRNGVAPCNPCIEDNTLTPGVSYAMTL